MSTFQQSNQRIADLAGSAIDADATVLRLNTLLADSPEVDICNVYKTDEDLTDAAELNCPTEALRDSACLIMRGNSVFERWGVEFDGTNHIAADYSDLIDDDSDLSISMWIKDVACENDGGCLLMQLGEIDEDQSFPAADNTKRLALIALPENGKLELRLATQYREEDAASNKSIRYPLVTRTPRTLGSWDSGDWMHIVLTVEHDSDGELSFGTESTDDGFEDLSFDLYVNGNKLNPTQALGGSAIDFENDLSVNQLLLFGEYLGRSYSAGLVGPIQIFDEKISESLISQLSSRFYLPNNGELNLSMRWEDYGTTSIFTRPAGESGEIEFANPGTYEPICGSEAAMPTQKIRICNTFNDADSFYELYETKIQELSSGDAFMFAKDPTDSADWDSRPYALYSHDEADDFCLSSTDPGETTDPEDSGWERLTDFKFFPGEDDDGNTRFFSQLTDSDLYQLLISSEFKAKGGQGLAAVGSLNITRKIEDDALCQIAPDGIEFSVPEASESTCDLQYANVLIQEGFQPSIDLLYLMPDSDNDEIGDYVTNWSPSDGSVPDCTASVNWDDDNGQTVNICRKTISAPDGTNYLQYTFRDIPVLGDDGTAVYDAETGVLKFDAGSGNTLSGEEWFQVLKQARYSYQDLVDETTAYNKFRTILFSLGQSIPFYPPDDPDTPHFYKFVTDTDDDSDIDWPVARMDAIDSDNKFCGMQGYLATITSEEENDFIFMRLSQDDGTIAAGWIGGTSHEDWDKTPEDGLFDNSPTDADSYPGIYRWIDGPEHGDIFYKYPYDSSSDSSSAKRTGRYVKKDPVGEQCLADDESDEGEADTDQTNLGRFVEGFDPLPNNSSNKCRPRPGELCKNLDLMFHNFQVRTNDDGSCFEPDDGSTHPVMDEPNDSQKDETREYFVQITGNLEGYGTWNDLRWDYEAADPNGQHKIHGYYVEYGGCTGSCVNNASKPDGLTITSKQEIDVSAMRRLCERPN